MTTPMQYIEMSGKTLLRLIDMTGMTADDLRKAGVSDETLVRVNRLGDLEMRKPHKWDVVGGLLGDFEHKLRHETGLDWA
jgi:hypothetical protein